MQFSPEYSDIVISAKKTGDGGIRLSVKDSGIGMEPEQVKMIVDGADVKSQEPVEELYHKNDANLSQIKSIAESHGGRFDLQSSRWDGTEVTLDLPGKILLPRESENNAAEETATVNLALAS
jgi:two-component system cell cycle sensor histidine kinase PleC